MVRIVVVQGVVVTQGTILSFRNVSVPFGRFVGTILFSFVFGQFVLWGL